MSLLPLPNWHGWLHHYGYAHADPFNRPMPIPAMGIFDSPDVTICFNSEWSPLLVGALLRLSYPELYIVDAQHDGIWAHNEALRLTSVIAGGDNACLPESIQSTECAYYPSWYAGIEYIPYNPFTGGDLPNNYAIAPFFRFSQIDTWFPDWIDDIFTGFIENTTGYLENDIFVSFLSLPTYQNPFDGLDYPTIKLTVQGSGILRLKFLLVPFGGRALISFDPVGIFDILQATWSSDDRIIELNRDILALVPETDVDAIEEIVLDTDATHEIYITFLPTINDEAPIFQYGGGFRGYELCGNLTIIDPTSGLPIDFQNQQTGIYQEGIVVTTYEEMRNAVREGNNLSKMDMAQRILLASSADNIGNAVTIDPDTGEITVKSNTGIQNSDIVAENQQHISGSVRNQALMFAKLFSEMNIQITNTFGIGTVQNVASFFLNPIEEALLDAVVSTYFTNNPQYTINIDALAESMFCAGNFYSGVFNYANSLSVEAELNTIIDFSKQIPSSTVSQWSDEGYAKPNDDYLGYGCTIKPTENHIFPADSFINQTQYWVDTAIPRAVNTLVRVTVSGKMTDSIDNGNQSDMFYRLESGNPNPIREGFSAFSFNHSGGGGAVTITPPATIQYNASGDYQFIYEVNNAFLRTKFKVQNTNAGADSWRANATGQINITIEDLGEA